MKILALFDFCETIVSTQTVGKFYRYYLKEELCYSQKKIFIYRIANFIMLYLKKDSIWLKFFDGIHVETLNYYSRQYAEYLYQEFLIKKIEEKIKWHIEQSHLVIIVSAGLSCYINFLAQKIGVQHVIAVNFQYRKERIQGKIDEASLCYGEKKVERLHKYLTILNEKEIDWAHSYAYSDHPSDLPMLNLVGNRFIVVRKGKNSRFSKDYLKKKNVQLIEY